MTIADIKVLVAFDFGLKRIGCAVGQTITKTSTPLEVIAAKDGVANSAQVEKIIKKWRPQALIVGVPLNMDGTDQAITEKARAFIQALKNHYDLTVFEVDERLTTKDARERLFAAGGYKALQGGQVDSVAAQLILQNWLASID